MKLIIVKEKIKKNQFVGNINELDETILCIEELVNLSKTYHIKMKDVRKIIANNGKSFENTYIEKVGEESTYSERGKLYNQFVGDFFELFAEFFLKTYNNDRRFGINNYEPVTENDYGVDGKGESYDDIPNRTPVVVQVKFRSNIIDEIAYSCLANTAWQGVKNFNIDINKNSNVILFTSSNGANYIAKKEIGNNLFEINTNSIEEEIGTNHFWIDFQKSFLENI